MQLQYYAKLLDFPWALQKFMYLSNLIMATIIFFKKFVIQKRIFRYLFYGVTSS